MTAILSPSVKKQLDEAFQGMEYEVWQPNPGMQTEALSRPEKEILYGGRRGGGKTDGSIAFFNRDVDHPKLRSLVIRKNIDDLVDWIDRAAQKYRPQGAVKTGGGSKPAMFRWPSGAVIRTGHLRDENAYTKYQGQEYQRMGVEELTQIPQERNYMMLMSSCRSTVPELKPQIFNTCNPDGPGFAWVKARWHLSGIPRDIIRVYDKEAGHYRIFIPAGIDDNPHLDRIDPGYRGFLNSLPDGLRQAWRDGSWDDPVIEGAYYTKELLKARKDGRIGTVPLDPRLRVHTVWDLGIGTANSDKNSMVIGFWQRTGIDIRLIDYYSNDSFGLEHYAGILEEKRQEFKYLYGTHFFPHDGSKHELATGQTIADSAKKLGITPLQLIPKGSIGTGIFKVRGMFNRLYINDTPAVAPFLNAIRNYRREWNETLLRWEDKPVEDWASHTADMLRMAATIEDQMTNESPEERAQKHLEHGTYQDLFQRRNREGRRGY